jgi:hypothetical protein
MHALENDSFVLLEYRGSVGSLIVQTLKAMEPPRLPAAAIFGFPHGFTIKPERHDGPLVRHPGVAILKAEATVFAIDAVDVLWWPGSEHRMPNARQPRKPNRKCFPLFIVGASCQHYCPEEFASWTGFLERDVLDGVLLTTMRASQAQSGVHQGGSRVRHC